MGMWTVCMPGWKRARPSRPRVMRRDWRFIWARVARPQGWSSARFLPMVVWWRASISPSLGVADWRTTRLEAGGWYRGSGVERSGLLLAEEIVDGSCGWATEEPEACT